jgi:cyclomaltodextrinase / maltogenic alpha-amylase / neopullulanase
MNNPQHIYHIFPLGLLREDLTNSPTQHPIACRNILELEKWIPHLLELRIDTVLLGPVFESETHGYDTTDQRKLDPRLGQWEDLVQLIAKFHNMGIRIVLDAVWNHTSRQHVAYRDILENGQESSFADWYENPQWETRNYFGDPFTIDCWNGCQDLPKLNLSNPEVEAEIFSIAKLWIEDLRIDGVRIDAADSMDRDFLGRLAEFCIRLKKDFWILGEVVHGDYRLWLEQGKLDSVTNYEGYKSLWSSFNDKNLFEVAYSLNRLFNAETGIYRNHKLLSFNENHDVSRIAGILKNRKHLYPLHLMHYTIPGIPSLYYGEEWGLDSLKQPQGDWNLRPGIPGTMPTHIPEPHLELQLKRFIDLYWDHVALREGSYREVLVTSEQFAFLRMHEAETLLIVINIDEFKVRLRLPVGHCRLTDLLNSDNGYGVYFSENGKVEVSIYPCWGSVYRVEPDL